MRAIHRSLLLAALIATVGNTSSALAGAACSSPSLLASLSTIPDPSGRPMVMVLIDEKPVALRVATGAGLSSLTKRAVRDLRAPTASSRIRLIDGTGQVESLEARLPSLTLDNLKLGETVFMVLPGDDAASGPELDVFGGIFGSEMLPVVDFDFDFAANKINIFSQDHCVGNVVYWRPPATAPAIAVVPMVLNDAGHITLRVELDGRRLNAMLDTGASATFLNLDLARRSFRVDLKAPDVEPAGEVTGGYSANVYRRRFKTLTFDTVTIENPMITMFPDMMTGMASNAPRTGSLFRTDRGLPDIILGMDTLSQLHVYVASRERKLYITAANPQQPAAPTPP
jgi:hypothetical protein